MPLSKKKKQTPPPASKQDFPVVGIGASAGGLEAFKKLLGAIPENSGMAYVLVQHLAPTHESLLTEILSKVTPVPVHEITDDIHLAPDNIYVIPSNKILISSDSVLKLTPRDHVKTSLLIDVFFTSLAEVHKELAVGIVLSGTGSDGTLGLKKIKVNAGITMAQDPQTAAYADMPQSAIDADAVDFILPPEKMPGQLLQIDGARRKPTLKKVQEKEKMNKEDEHVFRQIIALLRQRHGLDFTFYKQATIQRRLGRRMALHQKGNLSNYYKFLQDNKTEQDDLYNDLLIPVTSFFRDPKAFQALKDRVFPAIYKKKTGNEPIRIWVAGCSTGEEAYSIAICLHEYLGNKFSANQIQIFASDISEKAIVKARTAAYSKTDVENVSEDRLRNYFTKTDGSYLVHKTIRDVCIFAVHNFLKDPPFAHIHLISCRNVLIYMDPYLQKKALTAFHYSLNENGFLMLGKSETTSQVAELFAPFASHEKIYSSKSMPGSFMRAIGEHREEMLAKKDKTAELSQTPANDFRKSADAILLSKYTPAGVIINDQLDIVHIHGNITPFLETPPGKPTFNVLKMAKDGLGFELRNTIHKARASKATFTKKDIPVKNNGQMLSASLEVVPLNNTIDPHFLILFNETLPSPLLQRGNKKDHSRQQLKLNEALQRIDHLEKELAQSRDDMRSITEEQEAANEELQSANEELLSSSEELQSLNEELETSKEELQSGNEELTVINQELLDKQEQLNDARLYAESIVTTVREPLIIMDKNLRIKSANASFYKKFNLTEHETEGQLFYELQNHQWDDKELRSVLNRILPDKTIVSDFEIKLHFKSLGKRHLLLDAKQITNDKNTEPLILLAIEDITDIKEKEKLLLSHEIETKFRFLADNVPVMIWTAKADGKLNYFNKYLLDYTGLTFDEAKDDGWHQYIYPGDLEKMVRKWQQSVNEGKNFKIENRIRHYNGEYCWFLTQATVQKDSTGEITGWIGTKTEIEDQKNKEKQKDDFISIASHELKTPITTLNGYIYILQEMLASSKDQQTIQIIDKADKQTKKLTRLINTLLDITKIKQDQMQLSKSEFDIDKLIRETVDDMKVPANNHKIVLKLKSQKKITADKERIEEVVSNLISNAIKYSPRADKIVITSALDGQNVIICVQDFGMGISKEMQEKIFGRFFRINNDRMSTFPGLGLGLYIVAEIIKRHGGTISVRSEKDKGSEFCVTLPVKS
jgi:two-component system, chemotaxis family, CheB/CheR fusion protein